MPTYPIAADPGVAGWRAPHATGVSQPTVEVLTLLADRGQHRAPSITQVTGQPVERLSTGQ